MPLIPPPSGKEGHLRLFKRSRGGKRVVFVTHSYRAAEEEAKKYSEKGFRTEIKKEKDDTGTYVFTVFVFEGGFGF